MSDLTKVAKLVTDEHPDQAIKAMLAVWTKRPLPRLADAIDAVDRTRAKPWGPLFPDKAALAARGLRIAALAKQPRDPRFARALLDFVQAMPFTSTSSRGFWGFVFGLLDKLDDPRVITAIAEARKGWTIRAHQRAWLDMQAERLLVTYRERYPSGAPAPTASEAKLLDAIERAIGKATPTTNDRATHDSLLAAIYADPDDDGLRSVFADHIAEAGDPRGEFITLQLLANPTPAQTKRAKALLAKHERTWIGPLEPVIANDGVEFRRGFLASCRVKLKNAMVAQKYGTDPSWATVEHLRFTGSRFAYQAFSAQASGVFFVDPVMKSLRDINLHDHTDLALLLATKTPWKIERLATSPERSLGKTGLAALAKTDKLPALAALEMMAPPRGWLASAKFGKRLREVVLGLSDTNDARGAVTWVPELERLPALERATIVASRSSATYPRWTFARDASKRLSIATVVTTPERFDATAAMLAAFPATQFTSLAITLAPGQRRGVTVERNHRVAMTAAVARQTRLAAPVAIGEPRRRQ